VQAATLQLCPETKTVVLNDTPTSYWLYQTAGRIKEYP
jgi:hypothetical protein